MQQDFKAMGIKIDIQNYPSSTLFGSFLPTGNPSPPTGAVTGRDDIFEHGQGFNYDADDSTLFACTQFPPNGQNLNFYCNPALDKLFAQEQQTGDPAARQQIFHQIHQIYLTDFPFVTEYATVEISMHKLTVHNYNPGPEGATETVNNWEWWCDGGHC